MSVTTNETAERPPYMLTADDCRKMARITAACNDDDFGAMARMLREFYSDGDRATRMPRQLLYFHLGQLAGALARASGEPFDDDDWTSPDVPRS